MSQFHAASLSQGPFIFDSKFRVREGGVTEAPGESLKYIYASRSRLLQQQTLLLNVSCRPLGFFHRVHPSERAGQHHPSPQQAEEHRNCWPQVSPLHPRAAILRVAPGWAEQHHHSPQQAEKHRDLLGGSAPCHCARPGRESGANLPVTCPKGAWAEAFLVDVAASAARRRQAEQLRQCLQTLCYAAAAHGGQALGAHGGQAPA